MNAFYNEIDPFAAAWLRRLAETGHIASGFVDERSIVDIAPAELDGYRRCHFFAGIAGWDLALRLAGWPIDREVWTGSCPCQPFSAAGKQRGFADERHLWPAWFRLIKARRPAIIFGEQVSSGATIGGVQRKGSAEDAERSIVGVDWGAAERESQRAWLDAVFADLERADYACGAADIAAASVGAPHVRQRIFWVAVANLERRDGIDALLRTEPREVFETAGSGEASGLADMPSGGWREGDHDREGQAEWNGSRSSNDGRMGNARSARLEERGRFIGDDGSQQSAIERAGGESFWSSVEWLQCSDGKARPTKPGLFPLAHGVPGRVGKLRAYGNSIVPQAAAEFIKCVMDVL